MVVENGSAQPTPTTEQLTKTAFRLAAKGKGLLASDESIGTIGKRIEKAGLANTEVRQKLVCHRHLGKQLEHLTLCRKRDAAIERIFILLTSERAFLA